MSPTGVIILCHGSRGERGIVEVPETLLRITEQVKLLLPAEAEVRGAALQFNHPTLAEAAASLAAHGVNRVVIMPYFLFPGRHITEDIPRLIERLKGDYPETEFIMAKPLGIEEHFIGQVVKCIEEVVPELWSGASVSPASPEAIERQSMEIVERLLPLTLKMSPEERLIARRVVHASGDPQVAGLMRFSPSAIPGGLSAIARGSPIFTDVQMVSAGISKRLAEACGCPVLCALDGPGRSPRAAARDATRTSAAIRHLEKKLEGAILAVGNAPTALLAALDLVDREKIRPALIVGMPVGFISARESKEQLMKRDVPFITVVGTRGGSAMAVATVNALLKIALDRNNRD